MSGAMQLASLMQLMGAGGGGGQDGGMAAAMLARLMSLGGGGFANDKPSLDWNQDSMYVQQPSESEQGQVRKLCTVMLDTTVERGYGDADALGVFLNCSFLLKVCRYWQSVECEDLDQVLELLLEKADALVELLTREPPSTSTSTSETAAGEERGTAEAAEKETQREEERRYKLPFMACKLMVGLARTIMRGNTLGGARERLCRLCVERLLPDPSADGYVPRLAYLVTRVVEALWREQGGAAELVAEWERADSGGEAGEAGDGTAEEAGSSTPWVARRLAVACGDPSFSDFFCETVLRPCLEEGGDLSPVASDSGGEGERQGKGKLASSQVVRWLVDGGFVPELIAAMKAAETSNGSDDSPNLNRVTVLKMVAEGCTSGKPVAELSRRLMAGACDLLDMDVAELERRTQERAALTGGGYESQRTGPVLSYPLHGISAVLPGVRRAFLLAGESDYTSQLSDIAGRLPALIEALFGPKSVATALEVVAGLDFVQALLASSVPGIEAGLAECEAIEKCLSIVLDTPKSMRTSDLVLVRCTSIFEMCMNNADHSVATRLLEEPFGLAARIVAVLRGDTCSHNSRAHLIQWASMVQDACDDFCPEEGGADASTTSEASLEVDELAQSMGGILLDESSRRNGSGSPLGTRYLTGLDRAFGETLRKCVAGSAEWQSFTEEYLRKRLDEQSGKFLKVRPPAARGAALEDEPAVAEAAESDEPEGRPAETSIFME